MGRSVLNTRCVPRVRAEDCLKAFSGIAGESGGVLGL